MFFMQQAMMPHTALFFAMLFWGSSFIALKVALTAFTPWELMAGRMAVASLIFIPVLPQLWRTLRNKGGWGLIALMVISEPCLYFVFETQALLYTSAAQAGMLVSVLPLVVALMAFVFLRERTSPRTWCGLCLAGAGVVVLSAGGVATESSPAPLLGNILEGIAMCCATVYTLCARTLSLRYTALEITAMQVLAGLSFFGMAALLPLPAQLVTLPMPIAPWLPVASIIYLGTVVTFGGYGLYNYGIQRLSAGQAAAYTNLMPVIGLVLGVCLLEESFTAVQYAASLVVIAGVCISQQSRYTTKKSS
ncbi:MAG: EamA family transporter [Desulfovibrionaceae bacterium]|nr:EamA family transporter [Desulfovibrionaceae bacterium]